MMRSNTIFPRDLLPVLRVLCHQAICDESKLEGLDLKIKPSQITIGNKVTKSPFDKETVFVTYSEEETKPLSGASLTGDDKVGSLLSGNMVRQLISTAQVTVYADDLRTGYLLGDRIMDEMDKQRKDFRYFVLLDRHSALDEDLDVWAIVYKFKCQLNPIAVANEE